MGLLDFFQKKKPPKKNISVEIRGYVNGEEVTLPQDENPDEVKPIEYYKTIDAKIKPLESKLVGFASSLKQDKLIDHRISTLSMMISLFYEIKSKCDSLGPEYSDYFSKMWEHCHNSKNPDFSYIEQFEKELSDIRLHYDELKEKESLYFRESEGLVRRVILTIRQSPGILQKDIYRLFDPIVKNDIRDIVYQLEKDGTVKREKSGNTYKVTYCGE